MHAVNNAIGCSAIMARSRLNLILKDKGINSNFMLSDDKKVMSHIIKTSENTKITKNWSYNISSSLDIIN